MIRLMIYIAILFGSVWLGLKISASPGYVLINYNQWVIETSLWVAIAVMFVSFIAVYFLLRFISKIMGAQNALANWSRRRRLKKAQQWTSKGLQDLAEGNWKRAEKSLIKGAEDSQAPLINYLAAANAAQGEGDLDKRDDYLHKAMQSAENAEIAVGLTQAQLQFEKEELEQSLMTLEHLNQIVPNHKHVLNLLQRVYVRLGDWDSMQDLLPQLKKNKVLDQKALLDLEAQSTRALLKTSLTHIPKEELYKAWKKLPRYLQHDPENVLIYSEVLIGHDMYKEAEKLLHHAINENWYPALIRQYAKVDSPKASKQLAWAESWLNRYPEDPSLLITLGQLCLRNKLWGKAQRYFETALVHEKSVEIYKDLGQVYEELGHREKAIESYKKGLALAT